MKRNLKLFVAICLAFFMVSCSMLQVADTPIAAYSEALGCWTDSVTQFKFYYEKADDETKARWDKEFRPILTKAKDVLNLWKTHLDAGGSTINDMEQWKPLKNEIIYYIAKQMS